MSPAHASVPVIVPPGDTIVAGLATDIPLLLLPIRIVTRYQRTGGPGTAPTHLRVRIFPDLIHANGHDPALSADEIRVGQAYWRRLWRAGGDPGLRQRAHAWLLSTVDAPRAVWVVGRTTPSNLDAAPSKPVPDGADPPVRPAFPEPDTGPPDPTVWARLLPERWSVTVLSNNEVMGRWWSEPVRTALAMAPVLEDLPAGGTVDDLLAADDVRWIRDFAEAVDAGMALRVPLDGEARTAPIDLVVAGVRRGTGHAPALTDLLDAHRLTSGLEVVRPGTPTNTTDTVESGFSAVPADPEAYLSRQLWSPPPPARPPLGEPERLLRVPAADALGYAFGLDGPSAFDLAEHAADTSSRSERTMHRVLWEPTAGHTLRRLLTPASVFAPLIGDEDLDWTREWFRDWVRGAGPLPAFRVGPQPYGVLPVTARPDRLGEAQSPRQALADILDGFWDSWVASVGAVPALSPVAGEAGTPEQQALTVASVLGAVPHPTAFRLRAAPVRYETFEDEWNAALDNLVALLQNTSSNALTEFRDREEVLRGSAGIVGQQAAVSQLITLYVDWQANDPSGGIVDYQPVIDHLRAVLRPVLAAHDHRAALRRQHARFSGASLADPADPQLWYVEYGADGSGADGAFPELRLVAESPDQSAADIAAGLRGRAETARRIGPLLRPFVDLTAPRPVLYALIDHALRTVAYPRAADLADGLDDLAALAEDDDLADPVAELRRLLRETVGLATHRYDAWLTSIAAERLARQRSAAPAGLQVGCYGWVLGLKPDAGGPDTSGFIHAPSLDHAATAAILRSSWLAYATGAADAAFSVDLSADRLRRATWLLDCVRNGIDLGEALGSRFERRLHDNDLDQLIDDVRDAVRTAAPAPGVPATVVDGLPLALAYSDTARVEGTDPVLIAVEVIRTGLPPGKAELLDEILREGIADLDAVADALLGQSVHALVKGNLAQAGAALTVSGLGDSGVPELSFADTHRRSRVITHRLTAVLAAATATGGGLRQAAEPALTQWLSRLLPGTGDIGTHVQVLGDGGTPLGTIAATLAGLGLGAAELVALVPTGGDLAGSRLARVIEGSARRSAPVSGRPVRFVLDPAHPGNADLSDAAVAAGALRAAIGRARPLRPEDLAVPGDPPADPDVDELGRRRDDLATRLRQLSAEPVTDQLFQDRLADLLAVDPDATIAALDVDEDGRRAAALSAILARAAKAATALQAPFPDGWPDLPPRTRAGDLAGRLATAVSQALPVLPTFRPANAAALTTSLAGSGRRLGPAFSVSLWLLEAGRVHADAGALHEAVQLCEAATGAPVADYSLAQLPDVDGEPWAATGLPRADGGRLCLLSITDTAAALDRGPIAGLLFDGWTETVPDTHATSGVAVHIDSPGSRPPQSLLLATTDAGTPWDTTRLVGLLRETLRLVQFRAVGPATLQTWGHTLPAIFLPDEAQVSTHEPGEVRS